MRRRRFSSNFFTDTADEIKYDKDLVHAIKKQNYIYSITYKDQKKIENFKKFSRIVLIVIHCIRCKIKEAQLARDKEYERRAGVLENEFGNTPQVSESSEEDNSDDEMSMSKFNKKFKIGEPSPVKSKTFVMS